MAVRPTATTEVADSKSKGSLGSHLDYLKSDPATYYYEKFKATGNKYLRDDMWTEAATRGELGTYIDLLSRRQKDDAAGTKLANDKYDKFSDYTDYLDYDTYMLTLGSPYLDNTTSVERLSDDGYSFGTYTNQAWANKVLESTLQKYEAQLVQDNKENMSWWKRLGADLGTTSLELTGGVARFLNDFANLGEGVYNLFANEGNDDSLGQRFLYAFSNDENSTLNKVAERYEDMAFAIQRKYGYAVNAEEAYAAGYVPGSSIFSEQKSESRVLGGYTTWGEGLHGVVNSIGYMVPSMITGTLGANAGLKTLGTDIFYTGVFAGSVKDNIQAASEVGISYKDLNSGEIISNAALKTIGQRVVETLLGTTMGFISNTQLARGVGLGATRTIGQVGKTELQAAGLAALRGAKSFGKEGLEESLQDLSDGIVDYFYSKYGSEEMKDIYAKRAQETTSIKNLAQSFVLGGLTEFAIGAIGTLTYTISSNEVEINGELRKFTREIGEDEKGTYKLGVFQSMNLTRAIDTVNEWHDILNDENASVGDRKLAALKLNLAMNTLGSVYKSFGEDDAFKANQILVGYYNKLKAETATTAKLYSKDFANNLYNTFTDTYTKVHEKYLANTKEESKIKKAFEFLKDKLRKNNTTRVNNILTGKMVAGDPEVNMTKDKMELFKARLNDLGVVAIVGTDGTLVEKYQDIAVVPNQYLQDGDLASIVQGLSFEEVRKAVKTAMNPTQQKTLLTAYRKATGEDGTIEQAVNALLFDKHFYTRMLLMSEQSADKSLNKAEMLTFLSQIDQLVRGKAATEVENGKLTQQAYITLLNKVYQTMRTGLINYATKYSRLDLGAISDEIIPKDVKAEIKNNPNVIFSDLVDSLIHETKPKFFEDTFAKYDKAIDRFNTLLKDDEIVALKKAVRSPNLDDRVQAGMMLVLLTKGTESRTEGLDKLVYLPTSPDGILEKQYIKATEDFFGTSLEKLINGTYDTTELTTEAKQYIFTRFNQDGKGPFSDARSRLAGIREVLFNKSGNTLTLGIDGTPTRVIDKETFIKTEYLGTEGDKKFKQDLKNGKIKTVKDVSKVTLPNDVANIKIKYMSNLKNETSYINDGADYIVLGPSAKTVNLMHEITHATQFSLGVGMQRSLGGRYENFTLLPTTTAKSIMEYIQIHFPIVYQYTQRRKISNPDVMYFLLEGELRANSTLTSMMFDVGFTWTDKTRSVLVSPDGKQTWQMRMGKKESIEQFKADTAKIKAELEKTFVAKKSKTPEGQISLFDTDSSADRPLDQEDIKDLMDKDYIRDYIKDSALKNEDGTPIVFYRGAPDYGYLKKGSEENGVRFYSTKPFVATGYAGTGNHLFEGYISNLTKNEIVEIDVAGHWDNIVYDGQKYTTDELVQKVIREGKGKKGILLRNVIEDPVEDYEKPADDLIMLGNYDNLKRVTKFDNADFVETWLEKANGIEEGFGVPNEREVESIYEDYKQMYIRHERGQISDEVWEDYLDEFYDKYAKREVTKDEQIAYIKKQLRLLNNKENDNYDLDYIKRYVKENNLTDEFKYLFEQGSADRPLSEGQITMFEDETLSVPEQKIVKDIKTKLPKLTDNALVELDNMYIALSGNRTRPITKYEKAAIDLGKALKIRRLSPNEEFRLMGIKDADFNRIAEHQSERGLYHLAGDSIVTAPLMHIFDKLYADKIITKPLRLIELFAGYGSQNFALDYTNRDYESWKIAEWAIPSIQAYKDAHHYNDNTDYAAEMSKEDLVDYLSKVGVSQNYNAPVSKDRLNKYDISKLKTIYNNIKATNNLVNIQQITGESLDIKDTNKYDYLMTYSFPCQDLSQAGLRKGMHDIEDVDTEEQLSMYRDKVDASVKEEEETRSAMLWQVDRILNELYTNNKEMPKILLMENVPQVNQYRNKNDFNKWLKNLERYGYTNSYATLKASDYGVPQKRERTFMVSILNGPHFIFPGKVKLETTMTNLLDSKTNSNLYLTDRELLDFFSHAKSLKYLGNTSHHPINQKIAATLTTSQSKRADGGNFVSEMVSGEMDLFSLMHPKSDKGISEINDVITDLEKGNKLKPRQISMFEDEQGSADRPLSEGQITMFDTDELSNVQVIDTDIPTQIAKAKAKAKAEGKYVEVKKLKNGQTGIYTYKRRDISKKVASESNLKYFMKKGKGLEPNPGIKDFVIATTNEFDKLPNVLRTKIKGGTLTKLDVIDYVATANNIDDYTFKNIAKYIYENNDVAALTYDEMTKLEDTIDQLTIISYMLPEEKLNKKYTPDEIEEIRAKYAEQSEKGDTEFNKLWTKYQDRVMHVVAYDEEGKVHFETANADPEQLNSSFMLNYDGTFASLRDIYNIGKKIDFMQQSEKEGSSVWNWTGRKRKANTPYSYDKAAELSVEKDDELQETLSNMPKHKKIAVIEAYLTDELYKRLQSLPMSEKLKINPTEELTNLQIKLNDIALSSDVDINKMYLLAMGTKAGASQSIETIAQEATPYSEQPKTLNDYKNDFRSLGKQISNNLGKGTVRYNKYVPDDLKKYFNPDTHALTKEYLNLSQDELINVYNRLSTEVLPKLKELTARTVRRTEAKQVIEDKAKKLADKLFKERLEKEGLDSMASVGKDTDKPKTMKEKIQVEHIVRIQGQVFNSTIEENDLVHTLLETNWDKKQDVQVQGISSDKESEIANRKIFYEHNRDALLSAGLPAVEHAATWFMNSSMKINPTDPEFKRYLAISQYTLDYILSQAKQGGVYENINPNLKQKISNYVESIVSVSGSTMAIHNNMLNEIDPMRQWRNEDMEIDGVSIPQDKRDLLFDAIETNDIELIKKNQKAVLDYVAEHRSGKKSFYREAISVRNTFMLSSPLTAIRNKTSNMALKRLNKLADKIGNAMFKGTTKEGQIKFTGKITPEIQKFINDNFIDNKFFDSFVAGISKYNITEISQLGRNMAGMATKEAIVAQMVLKSMYGEYYNKNTFKTKFMNKVQQTIMKALSDDTYVREAALRYFGQLLAEHGYDLEKGVTDEVMNDFAKALSRALNDYQHSDNFFNSLESLIKEKGGEGWWFVYKNILPYASSGWNWFKTTMKYNPIALGKAIYNLHHLEQRIQKAESKYVLGKSDLAPEFVEAEIRRNIGRGTIGTIGMFFGAILAGLGWITLKDDDYGVPKLRIGNLTIDVSTIFGSSSVLAGAALMSGITDEKSLLEGLNRMCDFALQDMPLMDIVELDMYSDGGFSLGMDQLESIALSYIPNFISWFAGGTYSGEVKKSTFLQRAAAKIPFLANVLEKKVDPYTGNQGSWWDAFNRVVPYFSWDAASENEKKTEALGLTKNELKGTYTINDNTFTVKGKDLTTINKYYGTWNAEDLEEFYSNNKKVKVKVDNNYYWLTYNQMTNEQKRKAVQTIMSNNAEYAKIVAWINAGHKYYGSSTMIATLRQRGITNNIYVGTKGFVS